MKYGTKVSKGLIAKIVLAVSGFLGSIVFARVLGPEVYGIYGIVTAVVGILDNPFSGWGFAGQKRISEHEIPSTEIVGAVFGAGLVGIAVISLPLILSNPEIPTLEFSNSGLLVGITFVGVVLFKILQPLISGIGRFGDTMIMDSVRSLLTIPLQLVLVVYLGMGIFGMIYGLVAASLVLVPVSVYILGGMSVPSTSTLKGMWSFAKYSIPKGFAGTAYGKLDILLIGAILGAGLSGQYKVAWGLTIPAFMLSGVMSTGLFTKVSELDSQGNSLRSRIETNLSFTSIFAIPIFFGALAMPEKILVTVYGGQYRTAAPILVGLTFYQIIATQSTQLQSVLSGIDRPQDNLKVMSVTVVINVILGLVLGHMIGVMGIVFATIISEVCRYGLLLWGTRKQVSFSPIPKEVLMQFGSGGLMFVLISGILEVIVVKSWIHLLSIIGVGGLVYSISMFVLSTEVRVAAKSIYRDAITGE